MAPKSAIARDLCIGNKLQLYYERRRIGPIRTLIKWHDKAAKANNADYFYENVTNQKISTWGINGDADYQLNGVYSFTLAYLPFEKGSIV